MFCHLQTLKIAKKECRKIMVHPTFPPALVEKKFVRADTWWFKLKDKYLLLSKMSLALLTIFHGPRVESSFSVMGDVMDKKSGRMKCPLTLPFKRSDIV